MKKILISILSLLVILTNVSVVSNQNVMVIKAEEDNKEEIIDEKVKGVEKIANATKLTLGNAADQGFYLKVQEKKNELIEKIRNASSAEEARTIGDNALLEMAQTVRDVKTEAYEHAKNVVSTNVREARERSKYLDLTLEKFNEYEKELLNKLEDVKDDYSALEAIFTPLKTSVYDKLIEFEKEAAISKLEKHINDLKAENTYIYPKGKYLDDSLENFKKFLESITKDDFEYIDQNLKNNFEYANNVEKFNGSFYDSINNDEEAKINSVKVVEYTENEKKLIIHTSSQTAYVEFNPCELHGSSWCTKRIYVNNGIASFSYSKLPTNSTFVFFPHRYVYVDGAYGGPPMRLEPSGKPYLFTTPTEEVPLVLDNVQESLDEAIKLARSFANESKLGDYFDDNSEVKLWDLIRNSLELFNYSLLNGNKNKEELISATKELNALKEEFVKTLDLKETSIKEINELNNLDSDKKKELIQEIKDTADTNKINEILNKAKELNNPKPKDPIPEPTITNIKLDNNFFENKASLSFNAPLKSYVSILVNDKQVASLWVEDNNTITIPFNEYIFEKTKLSLVAINYELDKDGNPNINGERKISNEYIVEHKDIRPNIDAIILIENNKAKDSSYIQIKAKENTALLVFINDNEKPQEMIISDKNNNAFIKGNYIAKTTKFKVVPAYYQKDKKDIFLLGESKEITVEPKEVIIKDTKAPTVTNTYTPSLPDTGYTNNTLTLSLVSLSSAVYFLLKRKRS